MMASGSTIIRPSMEKRQKIILTVAVVLYAILLAIYDFLNAVKYGSATPDNNVSATAVLLFLIAVRKTKFFF
jgi:hypothetical protein